MRLREMETGSGAAARSALTTWEEPPTWRATDGAGAAGADGIIISRGLIICS